MSWLSKILNYVPKKEREGISLGNDALWEVVYDKKMGVPIFLRSLIDLLPSNSVLFLEGGSPSQHLLKYIEARKPSQITRVSLGTIWPRSRCFHMEVTAENLEGLAKLSEQIASPELAIHLHAYNGQRIILEWYDAFSDNFYISKEIAEDKIKSFCAKLGAQYKRVSSN